MNMITVNVRETKIVPRNITQAEFNLIQSMYRNPNGLKIEAIKFIRNQYNLSLKESKDLCDEIGNNLIPGM